MPHAPPPHRPRILSRWTARLFAAALSLLTAAVCTTPGHAEPQGIAVIVNSQNPSPNLSKEELRPLFLTKTTRWKSGERVRAVNLPKSDKTRHEFDRVVLGMSQEEADRYWVDRRIRGGEPPPARVASPAAVLLHVISNSTGIGYVPAGTDTSGARVIARIRGDKVTAP
jgi:ABC-type phosphate transport system substrate-binding protein